MTKACTCSKLRDLTHTPKRVYMYMWKRAYRNTYCSTEPQIVYLTNFFFFVLICFCCNFVVSAILHSKTKRNLNCVPTRTQHSCTRAAQRPLHHQHKRIAFFHFSLDSLSVQATCCLSIHLCARISAFHVKSFSIHLHTPYALHKHI